MLAKQQYVHGDEGEGVQHLQEQSDSAFMIVKDKLEKDDDDEGQCFDTNQQPNLQVPSLEEHCMHQPLEEGPKSEGESHEYIGGLEAVHVGEEVATKFAILGVVGPITA